ncbi:MAG: hypothetical protein SFX73_18420 [Kofleriaceae bacterium]|nr:hypothetical protein [Kofleriaceae bacterium]
MKTIILALSSVLMSACATEVDPDFLLDQEAVEGGADEESKADGNGLVRLERVTVTELNSHLSSVRGAQLIACFEGYQEEIDPNASYLTKAIADKFYSVTAPACHDWSMLSHMTKGVLDFRGVTKLLPWNLVESLLPWATPQLQAATVNGYVSPRKVPFLFLSDLWELQNANAMAREKDPTGIDLLAVRRAWSQVREESMLDREYLNPVTFGPGALEGSRLFPSLRAAFPLRGLALEETGYDAIDAFYEAGEGPDGDPAFAPIRTALRKGSIKKRFYFAGGGDEWSRHVLIVIDQHGQAWGMAMGYSE